MILSSHTKQKFWQLEFNTCGLKVCFILESDSVLFYGYYRAVRKPGMSVVLTVISLGTRVVLAYVLSAVPQIGVSGIWSAVPIGWILADLAGWIYYKKLQQR